MLGDLLPLSHTFFFSKVMFVQNQWTLPLVKLLEVSKCYQPGITTGSVSSGIQTKFVCSLKSRPYVQNTFHCYRSNVGESFFMTFIDRYIVIYSYSKTKQMRRFLKLFIFCITFYTFQTASPSIIRISGLYILYVQQQIYVKQVLLPAC
jgi:hypothetical protein